MADRLRHAVNASPLPRRTLVVAAVLALASASVMIDCKPADSAAGSNLPNCAPGQAITNEGDHYGCRNPCPPGQEASEGTVVRANGQIVGTCVASRQAIAEAPPPPPPAAPPPPTATPVAVFPSQSALAPGRSQQSDAQLDRTIIDDCLGKLNAIITAFESTPHSSDEQAAATIAKLNEAMDHQCGLIQKVKVDPGFGALVARIEAILARSKRFQKQQEAEAARKTAEYQRWLQTPDGRRATARNNCMESCNQRVSNCGSSCRSAFTTVGEVQLCMDSNCNIPGQQCWNDCEARYGK